MPHLTFKATLATSHPLKVYGGRALSKEDLEQIAKAVATGEMPLLREHDPRHQLVAQVNYAKVVEMEPGIWRVEVEYRVDEVAWNKLNLGEEKLGISIALIEQDFAPDVNDKKPPLSLAADAAHFGLESLQQAQAELSGHFSVGGGRLYQASEFPPPKVVIEMAVITLQTIPANLIATYLYNTLSNWFMKPKHAAKTVFDFRLRESDRSIDAYLETDDSSVVKDALGSLRGIVTPSPQGRSYEFNPTTRRWRRRS